MDRSNEIIKKYYRRFSYPGIPKGGLFMGGPPGIIPGAPDGPGGIPGNIPGGGVFMAGESVRDRLESGPSSSLLLETTFIENRRGQKYMDR